MSASQQVCATDCMVASHGACHIGIGEASEARANLERMGGCRCTGRLELNCLSLLSGSASAKAKYDVATLRKLAANPLTLHEVARVSVLHSSILDYLVKLANERYNILASWPDFTTAVS